VAATATGVGVGLTVTDGGEATQMRTDGFDLECEGGTLEVGRSSGGNQALPRRSFNGAKKADANDGPFRLVSKGKVSG
jgi:hypothetical protein